MSVVPKEILNCACYDCLNGKTQHSFDDEGFELSASVEAHWPYMREGDAAAESFVDYLVENGLFAYGPAKITRLVELGDRCDRLGSYEEIRDAVALWRRSKSDQVQKRDRSPKRCNSD